MSNVSSSSDPEEGNGARSLGWKTPLAVLAYYLACLTAATYPAALKLRTELMGGSFDLFQHMWIMRWYRTCLLEGRSIWICPELQYPVGAPLGNFSPLHFQSLLFVPLSLLIRNDILCFNLVWFFGMLTTGMGTFLLIWHLLRHRAAACFGGMLAMLSGPMMFHGRAHLELIHVGCFPLFLLAWMRFVERPGRRRLIEAAAAYILVALCAAYYVVFVIIPAVLFVAWELLRAWRRGEWHWLRSRIAWFVGFSALVIPFLALIFGNQIWAMSHGYSLPRSDVEFASLGTPPWTFVMPTVLHRLSILLPFNPFDAAGYGWTVGERVSYLGIVTLVLMHQAAVSHVRFPHRRFYWALFALLVLLSCGAYWHVGEREIGLPALWLKKHVVAFQMIRVPARFNLFAVVCAAVLAAAGLKAMLSRFANRRTRVAVFAILTVLAVADLTTVPFPTTEVPPLPACYDWIERHDPGAAFVEAPQSPSTGSTLSAICGLWQSQHQERTSAGYSGSGNAPFDNALTWNSPFRTESLADPNYLKSSDLTQIGMTTNVNFKDYAWLYMKVHGFRYVILHQWPGSVPEMPVYLDRIKQLLASSKVFEDERTVVYDHRKMARPTRPTLICSEGFRPGWCEKPVHVVGKRSTLSVYNPDAEQELRLGLEARSVRHPRIVRLLAGDRELARWEVPTDRHFLYVTEPFRLPAGVQLLTIACESETTPSSKEERAWDGDERAYSLRIGGVTILAHEPPLMPESDNKPLTIAVDDKPAEGENRTR